MTTRRFLALAAATVFVLLVAAFAGRTAQPALARAAAEPADLERLRAEVQSLKDQVARLQPAAAAGDAPPKEPAAAAAATGYVNVKHFGAKGDGVTDDTAALQAALDAAGNNAPWGFRGTIVFVPPGEYLISSTLNVYRMAFEMVGCGLGNSPPYAAAPGMGSVFRWNGPADAPMMKIRDSYGINIRRIRWEGKEGVAGTAAMALNWVPEDQQGTNGATVIEQCYFGRYAHTNQGIHKGDLGYGIVMDGENGNNDEFKIDRCTFVGCTAAGIRMPNSQSIWGSVNNLTLSECGIGIETAASLTGYNVCFDACGTDLKIGGTARVSLFGWQSERSKRLAEVAAYAALTTDGGVIQLSGIVGGVMIDAFPSDQSQIVLRNIRFTQNVQTPRPRIDFGPSEADGVVGLNFRVRAVDCEGLHADQLHLAGALYATVPESRGEVEFRVANDQNRPPGQFYHFHNFLRMNPPSARTLDTSRVDLAVAEVAPATINAPGPIGVQWTGAKIYAGVGSPENVVAASVGSLYLRTDGAGGSTLYVKESGAADSGWVAK